MDYLEGQNASGIKVGDRVKIVRAAMTNENGWDCGWAQAMDRTVGKEGTVRNNSGYNGLGVLVDGERGSWFYPYFVLGKVYEKPALATSAAVPGDRYIVKDSGEREKFESGMVRDIRIGKGRFDLISPIALRRLALVYEKGAIKYDARNWEKGSPIGRFMDSALRHLNEFKEGLRDEDHLAQAAWNIFCMIHFDETRPDLNDLPSYIREGKGGSDV